MIQDQRLARVVLASERAGETFLETRAAHLVELAIGFDGAGRVNAMLERRPGEVRERLLLAYGAGGTR